MSSNNTMTVVIKHPAKCTDGPAVASNKPTAPAHLVAIVEPLYPHITDRITLLWGSWELQQYLTSILLTDRENRQGFPIPVMSALFKIYNEHIKIAPATDPKQRTSVPKYMWDDIVHHG